MANISNTAKKISSPQHLTRSNNVGDSGERRFYDSCKAANLNIKKTTSKLDMYNHTDFVVNNVKFDVKGLKNSHKQGRLLLEIKNVQGKTGWCNSKSSPEYIAFDFGGFFLCVLNSHLYQFVTKNCDLKNKVNKVEDSLYKGYTRKDRQDLTTTILLKDALINCEHWFLPYQEYNQPMELL